MVGKILHCKVGPVVWHKWLEYQHIIHSWNDPNQASNDVVNISGVKVVLAVVCCVRRPLVICRIVGLGSKRDAVFIIRRRIGG